MNKAELRDAIQASLECSGTVAEKTLNTVLGAINDGLKKDGTVQIMGFGTFLVKDRAARTGRNPTTGDPIQIPASRTVQFRPGKSLKESV